MFSRITKTINTHVRYIILFKGIQSYQFTFCGPLISVKNNNLLIAGITIKIAPQYEIAISHDNLQCDCSMIYVFLQVEQETPWTHLPSIITTPVTEFQTLQTTPVLP